MAESLPPVLPGTDPTTWTGWIELINALQTGSIILPEDQQIAVYEAFEVWCQAHKVAPIYTVRQVITGFGEVVNPSPTTGTDIIIRPITELVPAAGGTAVAEIVKDGGVGIGLVKKGIAYTAALSLLAASIGAFQVSDENKARLEAVADDYTVDGENVPVLIDRSGNTFLQNDLLEAMRAEMVNMGVFDTSYSPSDPIDTDITFYGKTRSASTASRYTVSHTTYNGFRSYVHISGTFVDYQGKTVVGITENGVVHDCVFFWYFNLPYSSSTTPSMTVMAYCPSLSQSGGNYVGLAFSDGTSEGNNRSVFILGPSQTDLNTVIVEGISYSASNTQWQANGSPTPYRGRPGDASLYYAILNRVGGAGVEGITPAADLIQNGVTDLTKTLREVIPDLGPAIKTATPTDADLYDQTDWDPISLLGVNPWTDGLTEAQHESATDGKPDEKSQEDLLEAFKQLIADYFPDPTYPVPDPEPTPEPAPPVLDGSSNGLWAIYNPTKQQVKDFGAWLWSDSIIDQIERQFKNSPIDAVIGFHQIYCTPITGAAKTIKAGYLDSPVSAPEVTNQYADIDCGTVSVTEYYRNAIDYMMTKISLYLPFIGFVPLDAGIVMGSQVNIRYRIDVLTGACIAQVRVMKSGNTVVFYNYQGNCAVQIPLTASTYTGIVGALMGAVTAGVSVMTGNAAGAFAGVRGTVSSLAQGHQIQQSGSLGSNAGALGIRIPYMIIARPIQHMPAGFESMEGIPSNDTVRVGDCTGFLRVKSAHYDSITDATAEEVNMIRELLEGGIMV